MRARESPVVVGRPTRHEAVAELDFIRENLRRHHADVLYRIQLLTRRALLVDLLRERYQKRSPKQWERLTSR